MPGSGGCHRRVVDLLWAGGQARRLAHGCGGLSLGWSVGHGLEVGSIGHWSILGLFPHPEQVEGGIGTDILLAIRLGVTNCQGIKKCVSMTYLKNSP